MWKWGQSWTGGCAEHSGDGHLLPKLSADLRHQKSTQEARARPPRRGLCKNEARKILNNDDQKNTHSGRRFGGIYAALRLEKLLARRPELEVTLVTGDNYFLFTPMLPEVAAGDLELSTIVNPLRKLLKRVKTFVGTIEAFNLEGQRITVSHGLDGHCHELPYDQLILALGAGTNFFNLPGVEDSCITVKTVNDAVAIRNQLITHLEEANSECAAGERQPLLTFIVAGGGFAGGVPALYSGDTR